MLFEKYSIEKRFPGQSFSKMKKPANCEKGMLFT